MQQTDYKLFPPHVTSASVDWAMGITINEMPLNAATCEPADGAEVPAGALTVRGYAAATGRMIERVDLSSDGGLRWYQAEFERRPDAPWSWTFWKATLDLSVGNYELAVRAWDSAGQTQPAMAADAWNFKGYLSAAWHRVRVNVVA
jgi:sulfite oxidase